MKRRAGEMCYLRLSDMHSRRRIALLSLSTMIALVVGLAHAGCKSTSDLTDGAKCDQNADCKSQRCFQNICGGSACDPAVTPPACEAGWACVSSDADPVANYVGPAGPSACAAQCGHCPANMFCTGDATLDKSLCEIGVAPLEIDIAHVEGIVGKPITFTAEVTPKGTAVSCVWTFNDSAMPGTNGAPSADTLTITHTFKIDGGFNATATCTDPTGKNAAGTGEVDVTCQALQAICNPDFCCVGSTCAVDSVSGNMTCH